MKLKIGDKLHFLSACLSSKGSKYSIREKHGKD